MSPDVGRLIACAHPVQARPGRSVAEDQSAQDDRQTPALPRFSTALVGYRRQQVDTYLRQLFEAMSNLCHALEQREVELKSLTKDLAEARRERESLERRAQLEGEALEAAARHLAAATAAVARLRGEPHTTGRPHPAGAAKSSDNPGAELRLAGDAGSPRAGTRGIRPGGRPLPFQSWAISQLLRQQRRSARRSLDEAAAALGVSAFHLWRLEEGECLPSERLVQEAARYYGSGEAALELVRVLRSGGEPTVPAGERATPQAAATLAAR